MLRRVSSVLPFRQICTSYSASSSSEPLPLQVLPTVSNGSSVTVQGWVRRIQKRGKLLFARIYDGRSVNEVQVVIPRDIAESIACGSAVVIGGVWQESDGTQQSHEIMANECRVLASDSNARYDDLSPDQLRKKVYLRTRSQHFSALMRARSSIFHSTHQFFMDRGYVHIDTPLISSEDCEGAGDMFSLQTASKDDEFFGKSCANLTVSGQLHLESMTCGLPKVYTLNAGFRAEKQQSSTHLSEFRMLEIEHAFCNDLNFVCNITEDYFRAMYDASLSLADEVQCLGNYTDQSSLSLLSSYMTKSSAFPRVPYTEATNILRSKKQSMTGNGLNKQNEAFLVKYFNSPVFITMFPSEQKPFYMTRTENGAETLSFDFLCPTVGELAGGSVRENDVNKLASHGGTSWYTELRERGKPPSVGFGLGFERLMQVLFGVKNIKDTLPFPRWHKHCQC